MLRVTLVSVGRLKAGPERELVSRYLDRAIATGRSIGITVDIRDFDESRAKRAEDRRREEAVTLLTCIAPGAVTMSLDETGQALDSPAFAGLLATARNCGRGAFTMIIGGPDGIDPQFRFGTNHIVAFGAMTWPHQLVRVMAAEQIYRAVTILSGHPYHRG